MPVDEIASQRVDVKRDRRPGKLCPPADIARRVHDRQLSLQRRRHDGSARKVGNRMGHSSPQVVRAFVAPFEIKPLDPVREATGQDHRSIAVDGQPPDVRHQAVLPDDLRIQPARSPRGQHFDPDQHAERRSSHQERTVRQEAKVRHRLDGLQPPGRPAEAVEKAHGTQPAADRDIAAVRINRQERRLAGSGPLDAHPEIGIEQQQAGIIAFPEQRDQRSFITDRPCHDPLGNPGKRQRLPLCVQQVELVPLIPGKDPAGLARRTDP